MICIHYFGEKGARLVMTRRRDFGGVVRVGSCDLQISGSAWDYALNHAQEIERNWEQATRDTPSFFNGTVYLLQSREVVGGRLSGSFLKTDFKSYLYWRAQNFEDAGVFDAFGSGILRGNEGHVILGVQGPGHVNSGLAYTPGGFIDERDVDGDGCIDIDSSVGREILEETGLDVRKMNRVPGYLVTFHGAQISIGVEYRGRRSAIEIKDQICAHIASESNPELTSVTLVESPPPLETPGFAPFVIPLLGAVL